MKLLVLDGNSILNRAFYGIKLLTTKDGRYTNAIYGFLNILLKLEEEKLVVAEGNVGDTNCSGVVRREKDEHIRAIIRIPDGFIYE